MDKHGPKKNVFKKTYFNYWNKQKQLTHDENNHLLYAISPQDKGHHDSLHMLFFIIFELSCFRVETY